MLSAELIFWSAVGLVLYAYLAYPLLVWLLARLRPWPLARQEPYRGSVSIVLSVFNEEARIQRRLEELCRLLAAAERQSEIIVVSDGSTDRTAALVRHFTTQTEGVRSSRSVPVRLLELSENLGKAAALTRGCALAGNEIIVLADARQTWAPEALEKLLRHFADPSVGAVSGDLCLETAPGVMAGVGLYWRYEKWIRRQEGRLHSTVGVTGAISAVRRELFQPIPPRTLLDDVYWPMNVVLQGYRVIHDEEARAFDQLPEKAGDEFHRKVRTLSGNFQLVSRLPAVLLPWRNPIWWQLLSHKLLRLVVPWALLLALVCNLLLLHLTLYQLLLALQVVGYGLAVLGLTTAAGWQIRLASAGGSFLMLNAAAWLAFWVWISGKASQSWRKVLYRVAPAAPVSTPEPKPR